MIILPRVYKVDETGITVVQHKCSKIISVKGKKQVFASISLERGKLVTIVTCMIACGELCASINYFSYKKIAEGLMDGAPPGSIGVCHPLG